VTTTSFFFGIVRSTSLRLCCRAPLMTSSCPVKRRAAPLPLAWPFVLVFVRGARFVFAMRRGGGTEAERRGGAEDASGSVKPPCQSVRQRPCCYVFEKVKGAVATPAFLYYLWGWSKVPGRNVQAATSAENPSTLATPLRHRPRRRPRAERRRACGRAAGAGECGGRRRPRAGADAGRVPPRARLAQPLLEYGRRRVRRDAPAARGPRALRRARPPRPHALHWLSRAERALRGADRRAEPPERALPRPPRRHRILDDPPGDAAPLARTWLRVFAPPAG